MLFVQQDGDRVKEVPDDAPVLARPPSALPMPTPPAPPSSASSPTPVPLPMPTPPVSPTSAAEGHFEAEAVHIELPPRTSKLSGADSADDEVQAVESSSVHHSEVTTVHHHHDDDDGSDDVSMCDV